jgi:predicted RNA-binding protein (virulence factor B family)
MRIVPGKIQKLPLFESVDRGFLLGSQDNSVFISKRDIKQGTDPGTEIEVFVFYNEEKELEATTKLPQLQLGEVGCFRVGNSNDLGAFIDIGSRRDILIPHKEQVEGLETGRMTLVVLCDDPVNRRLYASTKLNRHLRNENIPYKRGDAVQLTIAERIEIGRRVVIDGKFIGALFRQEMMDKVRLGEKVKGYIRKIEGKDIIVSMQREGLDLLDDSKAMILDYLEANGGYVRLNDDTDPEEIKLRLHMSKKTFKRAAGMLFKEGKVLLTKFGIKINKTGEIPEGWESHKILVDEEMGGGKKTSHQSKDERHGEKRTTAYAQEGRKDKSTSTGRSAPKSPERRPAADKEKRSSSSKPDAHIKKSFSKEEGHQRPASEKPTGGDAERRDKKPVKQLTFKGKK